MSKNKVTLDVVGIQTDLQRRSRDLKHTSEIAVIVMYWVISRLREDLGHIVNDMEFEVIKTYGKFGGAYPTIVIVSDTLQSFDDTYILIKNKSAELVKEGSIVELIQFIEDTDRDWIGVAKEIMRKD